MNLNRPLQIKRQDRRRLQKNAAGRYKSGGVELLQFIIDAEKPAGRRRYAQVTPNKRRQLKHGRYKAIFSRQFHGLVICGVALEFHCEIHDRADGYACGAFG